MTAFRWLIHRKVPKATANNLKVLWPAQVAALEKENRELGERSAAIGLEASEKAREAAELDAKLAAAGKAAEKLRQALKRLERERDARPLPEALVGRPSLCIFTPAAQPVRWHRHGIGLDGAGWQCKSGIRPASLLLTHPAPSCSAALLCVHQTEHKGSKSVL